jgi:hypothetical protein
MLTIKLEGVEELQRDLADFSQRRLNSTVATALTRTAVKVRDQIRAELPKVFDRPTPYTLNSLFAKPARADRLQAEVFFRDELAISQQGTPATKYLLPHVNGTPRRLKRLEVSLQAAGALPAGWFVVPGQGAPLDGYGNVTRGAIIQVLSQLRITLVSGFTRNLSLDDRRKASAIRRAGGRYFVIPPGGETQPGIYQRELIGRNITPVFIFVQSVSYGRRFDFYPLARRLTDETLPGEVDRAVRESAARLRARRSA